MDNQHQHIKGYRDLTKAEIDLMNEVKLLESQVQATLDSVSTRYKDVLDQEAKKGALERALYEDRLKVHAHLFNKSHDGLMVAFMLAVRSIAQPQPLPVQQQTKVE